MVIEKIRLRITCLRHDKKEVLARRHREHRELRKKIMNIEEVHNLIKAGESQNVEFKNSFGSKVIIALNAFINAKGGKVIIGVSDAGDINGVEQSKESLQSWLNEIKTKTEPLIIPDVECFEIDGKNVVVMNVAEFPIKPISYQGRYYIRKNNSNHQLNATQIADMHLISLQYSWDSYSFPNIELDALSTDKIDDFINNINNTGRFNYKGDRWDVLGKLSLINENKPTIAAVLLFAKIAQRQHIRIGRFKSHTNIIDDRQITETLFTAAEDALTFIKNYIKIEYIFEGDIKRKERWEYPLDAIKESLLNAIVHPIRYVKYWLICKNKLGKLSNGVHPVRYLKKQKTLSNGVNPVRYLRQ